jgi:hypothetical protein
MKNLAEKSTQEEILKRLKSVRPDSPRKWGKMNPHQMVCHLADSYRGVMGQKPVGKKSGIFQRTVMKWGALYFPLPWPHGIQTMPEMDQLQGGTLPVELQYDINELTALMAQFLAAKKVPHPIFGVMTGEEWARWGYLHMDHHLRQFGC